MIINLLKNQSSNEYGDKNKNEEGGGPNKAFYVEESVKILEGIIMKADPILSELVSKVKQFEKVSKISA